MRSITFVIPTRDRPAALARALDAVGELAYGGEVEVIVVSDGGGPIELASDLAAQVVETPGRGPAAARNAGAAAASAELIAFLDDDCEPAADWLERLVSRLDEDGATAVGGRIVNSLSGDARAEAAQAIVDSVYAVHDVDPSRATFLASSNLLVPAERFRALAGFDESFPAPGGEDRDFCRRWLESGGRLVWEPAAVIAHSHPLTVGGFARQQFAYGRGAWLERRARARRGGRFRVEPALTSGIFSGAMRVAIAERRLGRAALLCLWQLANLAGFAAGAVSEGLSSVRRSARRR